VETYYYVVRWEVKQEKAELQFLLHKSFQFRIIYFVLRSSSSDSSEVALSVQRRIGSVLCTG